MPAPARRARRPAAPMIASGVVALPLLAALLAGLTGCAPAASPAPSTPAPAPLPEVSVVVLQNRTDLAGGRMQLRVVNDSPDPLSVQSAVYADPRFAGRAEWAGDSTVPPGTARDLPVAIPAAACGDGADSATGAGSVELRYTTSTGGAAVATLVPTDPFDMVAAVTGAECAAVAVRAAADIALTDDLAFEGGGPDEVASSPCACRRPARCRSRSTRCRARCCCSRTTARSPGRWPARPSRARPGPSSCGRSRRAATRMWVAEDKVGTLLPTVVTVGSGADAVQARLTLPASTQLRAQLYAYVGRSCGWDAR